MKYLAIDYGEKRIGLAQADDELQIPTPYKTISAEDNQNQLEEIVSTIENNNFNQVIVGLPLSTDGSENEKTREVRGFTNKLKDKVNVEFEFVDERFSSQEADSIGGNTSRDEKSAMLILDTFLG